MELHADERAVLDDGSVPLARCHGRVGHGLVRVREPVRLAARVDGRPPDARDAFRLQTYGPARHEAEAGDAAVLLALVERELEAEADAEIRPTRRVPRAERA